LEAETVARYERGYVGERRTVKRTVKLTPGEDAELEAAAAEVGAPTVSQFARELLFRRLLAVVAAGTRRNPEAKALLDAINAVGNNLNQLMRHANSTGELGPERLEAVDAVLLALKAAAARVIAL
jgi:hypothetical protein